MLEQPFLHKHQEIVKRSQAVLYTVRKDNTISFRSNLYSLPLGTYSGRGTKVSLVMDQDTLQIASTTGVDICTHKLSSGKGLKIVNSDHKRDKTTVIGDLIRIISSFTEIPEQTSEWLATIRSAKPRYVRDQLLLVRKTIESNERELITRIIRYCLTNKIASAIDFEAIVQQHHRTATNDDQKVIPLNPLSGDHLNNAVVQPQKSSIGDYQDIVNKSSK